MNGVLFEVNLMRGEDSTFSKRERLGKARSDDNAVSPLNNIRWLVEMKAPLCNGKRVISV